jgi:hypothetical protein
LAEVAEQLHTLQEAETPLVAMLERRPGEKESRYRHLLSDESTDAPPPSQEAPTLSERGDATRVAELERELTSLRDRVTRMERELGLDS